MKNNFDQQKANLEVTLSRRSMLQRSVAGSLAASAAMLVGRQLHAIEATNMKMGLVTYLWGKDMELPELITACEKSGLLGVEVRTEHRHGVEPSLNAAQREEVRKRFADSPVELVGYGANSEFHSDDPAKVRENIEQAKEYVRLMHDCGGGGVKVKPNGFSDGLTREQTIEQIGKSLNELAEYGEGFGQKIRVEVHGAGTSELPVIRDIFEVADHPNVYVCWNSNGDDVSGAGLEANFAMVQKRLGDTVHVREFNEGDYPYQQLMNLFKAMSYEGWILLEARTNPTDKVAAMIEQRLLFEKMLDAKS